MMIRAPSSRVSTIALRCLDDSPSPCGDRTFSPKNAVLMPSVWHISCSVLAWDHREREAHQPRISAIPQLGAITTDSGSKVFGVLRIPGFCAGCSILQALSAVFI
jgi:hypothetical protein